MSDTRQFKIGNKKYPVNFGKYASAEFANEMGISLDDFFGGKFQMGYKELLKIIYWGMVAGHMDKNNGEDFPLNYFQVTRLLDKYNEVEDRLTKFFLDSRGIDLNAIEDQAKDEETEIPEGEGKP